MAVVDTGINAQHEALEGNLLGGRNFVPDDPYDPGSAVDPNAFEDLNGHGSHCAGAVAGNGPILGVGPAWRFGPIASSRRTVEGPPTGSSEGWLPPPTIAST